MTDTKNEKRCRNGVPKSTQTRKDKSDGKYTKPHHPIIFSQKTKDVGTKHSRGSAYSMMLKKIHYGFLCTESNTFCRNCPAVKIAPPYVMNLADHKSTKTERLSALNKL